MRRSLTIFTLALCISVLLASASRAQESNSVAQPNIVKKVLDNGLTLIVKPEKGAGLVSIVALVRAGANQEGIGTAGIGNYVTRLLLASTRLNSADNVAGIADEVGGNITAAWHPDFAEMRAVTTTTRFGDAMSLIGECLTEASFEGQWVEQARSDILASMQPDTGDIFEQAYTDLRRMLYEDNGYKRTTDRIRDVVSRATPENLKRFYSSYYMPNNIVISVVGDVTVEQALKRADIAFAGVPAGKLPVDRGVPDEKLDRNKFQASEAELSAAYLMLGWLAPGMASPDYPAMAVATNALGGGKGSMMFRELRQKRGMGYDIGARYPRLRYQSHVLAYVITDPFKASLPSLAPKAALDDVKAELLKQVDRLKEAPLSEQDLQRAKGYTIGAYALDHQHLYDRAFHLAWLETVGVGYDYDKHFEDAVEKVTAADLQRVAKKYFTEYAAILLLPKTKSTTTKE